MKELMVNRGRRRPERREVGGSKDEEEVALDPKKKKVGDGGGGGGGEGGGERGGVVKAAAGSGLNSLKDSSSFYRASPPGQVRGQVKDETSLFRRRESFHFSDFFTK